MPNPVLPNFYVMGTSFNFKPLTKPELKKYILIFRNSLINLKNHTTRPEQALLGT